MAVQFPNFLNVPIRTGQYDALGDIVQNYYAGKSMPKDDLIKAIQAEFARPNAEQSLLASKLENRGKGLSNRKSQLDIDKMVQDIADQKAFEQQLRNALGGGATGAMPAMGGATGAAPMSAQPPMQMPPAVGGAPRPVQMNPALGQQLGQGGGTQNVDVGEPDAYGIDPTKIDRRYRKFDQMATGLPDSAYKAGASPAAGQPPMAAPQGMPTAPMALPQQPAAPEEPNEIVVAKGSPHLSGVDAMYENSPLSRAFLEKKGFKKQTEVKFDNKTGKTTVMTKYPSGKVTLQSIGGMTGEEGIPLTNKMVAKHQNVIASVDVALPVLKKISNLDDADFSRWSTTNRGAKYNALVSQVLDSLIGAFGMPSTDKGLQSVRDQVEIGHGESAEAYKKRIAELIADLNERKNYSAGEVKRSNKISPVSAGNTSNIDDPDPTGMFGGQE